MKARRFEQLEIHHLKTFLTLYQVRNTTKTAEKLGVSQSAISRSLKKLRETFDDLMFIRSQAGLAPTEFADQLYSKLPDAVDALVSAFSPVEQFDPSQITDELRIAFRPEALELIGSELFLKIKKEAPNAMIRFDQCGAATTDNLLNDQIHMALNHELISHPKELYYKTLLQDELCFYTRKQHALVTGNHSPEVLNQFGLSVCIGTEINKSMKAKDKIESLTGLNFDIALKCGELSTAVKIVSRSNMILAGSRMFLACYPEELHEISLDVPKDIQIPFSIAVLHKNRTKGLYKWLESIIFDLMKQKVI